METWYRVYSRSTSEDAIQEIEVVKSTDKCVFTKPWHEGGKPDRHLIETSYEKWYRIRDEAVSAIKANKNREDKINAENRLKKAAPQLLEALQDARSRLDELIMGEISKEDLSLLIKINSAIKAATE